MYRGVWIAFSKFLMVDFFSPKFELATELYQFPGTVRFYAIFHAVRAKLSFCRILLPVARLYQLSGTFRLFANFKVLWALFSFCRLFFRLQDCTNFPGKSVLLLFSTHYIVLINSTIKPYMFSIFLKFRFRHRYFRRNLTSYWVTY